MWTKPRVIQQNSLGNDRIVCIGDSIVQGAVTDARNFPLWLSFLTQSYVLNKGISGNKLEDVDLRLTADVIDNKPGVCVILCGTNNTSETAAQIAAKMAGITTKLLDAKITPVWCTLLPRSDNPAAMPIIRKVNYWLAAHCADKGIPLIDLYTTFANSDGTPKAGYLLGDNLHPTTFGMRLIANLVSAVLPNSSREVPWRLLGDAESIVTNGAFETDTNADGLADSWNKLGSGTPPFNWTLENHPDFGKWQVIKKDPSASRSNGGIYRQFLLTAGSTYRVYADVEFTGTVEGADNPNINVYTANLDASNAFVGPTVSILPSSANTSLGKTRLVLDFTVPVGATKTNVYFEGQAKNAFTLKVGRVSIIDLLGGI